MEEHVKQTIKSLQIIYGALVIGVALFIVVTVYLNMIEGGLGTEFENDIKNILLIAGTIIGFCAVAAGMYIFNMRMKGIEDLDTGDKIIKYRSSMIFRAAAIEGAAFIFIVFYLITASNIILAEAIIVFAVLAYFFPSKERLSKEMHIDLTNLQ